MAADLTGLSGFRAPSGPEIEAVSRIMDCHYRRSASVSGFFSTALCAAGLIAMFSYAQISVTAIVLGLLCYGGAVLAIRSKHRSRQCQRVFASGDFLVLEGSVLETGSVSDAPGFQQVRFVSRYGQVCGDWFSARMEGLEPGTYLLLVYADETRVPHGLTWVFTPFMLTEEAAKLRW